MIPQERRPDRERQRRSRGRRGTQRAGRSAQGAPGSGDSRAQRVEQADDGAAWAGGLQAVPIVEVGMRIRAHDGQGGIVLDALDCAGTLTYLVQLDGHTSAQFMPARTLKGAQL